MKHGSKVEDERLPAAPGPPLYSAFRSAEPRAGLGPSG